MARLFSLSDGYGFCAALLCFQSCYLAVGQFTLYAKRYPGVTSKFSILLGNVGNYPPWTCWFILTHQQFDTFVWWRPQGWTLDLLRYQAGKRSLGIRLHPIETAGWCWMIWDHLLILYCQGAAKHCKAMGRRKVQRMPYRYLTTINNNVCDSYDNEWLQYN